MPAAIPGEIQPGAFTPAQDNDAPPIEPPPVEPPGLCLPATVDIVANVLTVDIAPHKTTVEVTCD